MAQARSPLSPHQPKRPLIAAWRLTDAELSLARQHVTIDLDRISALLPWIAPGTPSTAWRTYVSPVDDAKPDLARIYYELALTISQFGGFVEKHIGGWTDLWKLDGSGVKALLAAMGSIRREKLIPGIDIHDGFRERLACFFMSATFAKQRTDMICEIATQGGIAFFHRHLASARTSDGVFRFTIMHMVGLAQRFPLSFGNDAPFYKKASLLLLTMEIALTQLGQRAEAMTVPPADYRIPQILEGLGVLRLSPELSAKIEARHLFAATDPEVRALRSMTIEATGHIRSAYEQYYRCKVGSGELDGMLYLLSRNEELTRRAIQRPHILVATPAF